MIELELGKNLSINLKEDSQGHDRVIVALQIEECEFQLTPHQARVLATELIMAVNRAEVRSNLKHSNNMARGTPSQKRALFNQGLAKYI